MQKISQKNLLKTILIVLMVLSAMAFLVINLFVQNNSSEKNPTLVETQVVQAQQQTAQPTVQPTAQTNQCIYPKNGVETEAQVAQTKAQSNENNGKFVEATPYANFSGTIVLMVEKYNHETAQYERSYTFSGSLSANNYIASQYDSVSFSYSGSSIKLDSGTSYKYSLTGSGKGLYKVINGNYSLLSNGSIESGYDYYFSSSDSNYSRIVFCLRSMPYQSNISMQIDSGVQSFDFKYYSQGSLRTVSSSYSTSFQSYYDTTFFVYPTYKSGYGYNYYNIGDTNTPTNPSYNSSYYSGICQGDFSLGIVSKTTSVTVNIISCYTSNWTNYISGDATGGYVNFPGDGWVISAATPVTVGNTCYTNALTKPDYIFVGAFSGFSSSSGGYGTQYSSSYNGSYHEIPLHNVTTNLTIYYIFKIKPKLTISWGTGIGSATVASSSISNNGSVYIAAGTSTNINVAISTGYQFVNWASSNTSQIANSTNSSYTFNMPNALSTTLTASAKLLTYVINLQTSHTNDGVAWTSATTTGGTVSSSDLSGYGATANKSVNFGASFTAFAKPAAGYSFLGFNSSAQGGGTNFEATYNSANNYYSYTFSNVTAAATYYAIFAKNYSFTLQKDDGVEGVGGQTGKTYYVGQILSNSDFNVNIKNGYSFAGWQVVNGTIPGGFVPSATTQTAILRMPASNFTINATTLLNQYALNVLASFTNNGTWQNATTGGTVKIGSAGAPDANTSLQLNYLSTTTIFAQPAAGYYFAGWFKKAYGETSETFVGKELSLLTAQMPFAANATDVALIYTAKFIKQYTLALFSGTGVESVTISSAAGDGEELSLNENGNATVYFGQAVNISATLSTGYKWDASSAWALGAESTTPSTFAAGSQNQQIVIAAGNTTLTANATIMQFQLAVYAFSTTNGTYINNTTGGTICIGQSSGTELQTQNVDFQTSQTITAIPAAGYVFLGWFTGLAGDVFTGEVSKTTNITTEAMGTAGQTYYARFVKTYEIQFAKGTGVLLVAATSENLSSAGAGLGFVLGTGTSEQLHDTPEQTSTLAATFYYGQQVEIQSTINTSSYVFNKWLIEGSLKTFNDIENFQTIEVGSQNVSLTPSTNPRPFILTLNFLTENSSLGSYSLNTLGGQLAEGFSLANLPFGTTLANLVVANSGFKLKGFYSDFNPETSALGGEYLGTTMPNSDLTLFVAFQREAFLLGVKTFSTSAQNNTEFTENTTGGLAVATKTNVQFGGTTTIDIIIEPGFEIAGVYRGVSAADITAFNKTNIIPVASGANFVATTEEMPLDGLNYIIAFARSTFGISITEGEGTTLAIQQTAYFQQKISFAAYLKQGYENLCITAFSTANQSQNVSIEGAALTMPAFDITIETSSTPINYALIYNANGGFFGAEFATALQPNGTILGQIAFNRNSYSYYSNAMQTELTQQIPVPTRSGYKLIGFSTQQNFDNEELLYINLRGQTPALKNWDLTNSQASTLYAVWEIEKIDVQVAEIKTNFIYDGTQKIVLTATVNNFIVGKEYVFTWFNQSGTQVFQETSIASQTPLTQKANTSKILNSSAQTQLLKNLNQTQAQTQSLAQIQSLTQAQTQTSTSAPSSSLSLRSVAQSGQFYVVVSIASETPTINAISQHVQVTIAQAELIINIGNVLQVGTYVLNLLNSSLTGLAATQTLKSGLLTFNEVYGTTTIYSEVNNKDAIKTEINLQNLEGQTSEDGGPLIDNYAIMFTGSATIESKINFAKVLLQTGERTINPTTLENQFNTTTLAGSDYNMAYMFSGENAFTLAQHNILSGGVLENFVHKTKLGVNGLLIITLNEVPQNYEIFGLAFNQRLLQANQFQIIGNQITLVITEDMLTSEAESGYNLASVVVYLTKQALLTYEYNFVSGEIAEGYATCDGITQRIVTKGQIFETPTPNRNGFNFIGWFLDSSLQNPVGAIWETTSNAKIYAAYSLKNLASNDINILVQNESNQPANATKIYNGQAIVLCYEIINENYNPLAINYNVSWLYSAIANDNFSQIAITSNLQIKDVLQSGYYKASVSQTVNQSASSAEQTFQNFEQVQSAMQQIIITPFIISTSQMPQIEKTYNATTSLGASFYATGANGERVLLQGNFASADVAYNSINPHQIDNINLVLTLADNIAENVLASNYQLNTNQTFVGKILPFEYIINKTGLTKEFNGEAFSQQFTDVITLPGGVVHQVSYQLNTSSGNYGIYKTTTEEHQILLQNLSITTEAESNTVALKNYVISIAAQMQITITKTLIKDVVFQNKTVVYNAQNHSIFATSANGLITFVGTNLPDGATSMQYLYIGAPISDNYFFQNAGMYEITATFTADENHENLTLTAILTIETAKISFNFLNAGNALAAMYQYSGIDMFSMLSITAVNESATSVLPDFTKQVTKNEIEVAIVQDVGTYVLSAILSDANFQLAVSAQNSATFQIIAKIYVVGEDIIFQNNNLTYNATNLAQIFINENLINNATGITLGSETIINEAGQTVGQAINAGAYTIEVQLTSTNLTNWQVSQNFIQAQLIISPLELTNSNSTLFCSKTYDGNTTLPQNAQLTVSMMGESGGNITQLLAVSGAYASANVANNIQITSLEIFDKQIEEQLFLAKNFILASNYNAVAQITPKTLEINLYANNGQGPEFVLNKFIAENVAAEFLISPTNNLAHISPENGLANGEKLEIAFKTLGGAIGKYTFSATETTGNFVVINPSIPAQIFDASGNPKANGMANYTLIVNGGIEIIAVLTTATIQSQTSNLYIGAPISFEIKLTTTSTQHPNFNQTMLAEFVFDAETKTEYFVNLETNQRIPTETLSALFSLQTPSGNVLNSAAGSPSIFNAGTYTITLLSQNKTYVFAVAAENQATLTLQIAQANLQVNFGTQTIIYGANLNFNIENVVATQSEMFKFNITYETWDFDVNTYDFSNTQLFTWVVAAEGSQSAQNGTANVIASNTSTANSENYIFSFIGNLVVKPQIITAENVYSALGLTYNGQNQQTAVLAVENLFKNENNQQIILAPVIDYHISMLWAGTAQTPQTPQTIAEIINAGIYIARLSSTNYTFVDGFAGTGDNANKNYIDLQFEVAKANLKIKLQSSENPNDFLKMQFDNTNKSLFINAQPNSNVANSPIISGLVDGQKLSVGFATGGAAVKKYPISTTEISGDYTMLKPENINAGKRQGASTTRVISGTGSNFGLTLSQAAALAQLGQRADFSNFVTIHDEQNNLILSGAENYHIEFFGGIEIVYVFTTAEFINLNGTEYSGQSKEINLRLTTQNINGGAPLIQNLLYNSTTQLIENINTSEIYTNMQLKLNIIYDGMPVSQILDSGTYTLSLLSSNFTFTLSNDFLTPAQQNTLQFQAIIMPKNVTLDIETSAEIKNQIEYMQVFEKTQQFNDVGGTGKMLNLKFQLPQTAEMDVGEYNFANLITAQNFQLSTEGAISTGLLKNFNLAFSGSFKITPMEVETMLNIDSLNFIYSAENQFAEANAAPIVFTHKAAGTQVTVPTSGFAKAFYTASIAPENKTTDLINAGFYYVVLSSKNLNFAGGSLQNKTYYISFQFQIKQKQLVISLFANKSQNKYYDMPYTGENVTLQINQHNTAKLATGMVAGETLLFDIVSSEANEGNYKFELPSQITELQYSTLANGITPAEIVVNNKNGIVLINGINNYAITFEGGLEIVKNLTLVEFVDFQAAQNSVTYNGAAHEINIKLTTLDVLQDDGTFANIVKNIKYVYNSQAPLSAAAKGLYSVSTLNTGSILNAGSVTNSNIATNSNMSTNQNSVLNMGSHANTNSAIATNSALGIGSVTKAGSVFAIGSGFGASSVFGAAGSYLIDVDTQEIINPNELALVINFSNFNGADVQQTNQIINAGNYELVLSSANLSYVFQNSSANKFSFAYNLKVEKANLICDIGEQNITYGQQFNFKNTTAFAGQNNQQLYLNFFYNTSSFPANKTGYDFANTQIFADGIGVELNLDAGFESTGAIENYNIITTGTLKILALQTLVKLDVSGLRLVYSGTDYLPQILQFIENNTAFLKNINGQPSQALNLVLGTAQQVADGAADYYVLIKNAQTQTIATQIFNASNYVIEIVSQNYNLGSETSENLFVFQQNITVSPKEINVEFSEVGNIQYCATAQNPIIFQLVGNIFPADLNALNDDATIMYYRGENAENLVGHNVVNAGAYTAKVQFEETINYVINLQANAHQFRVLPVDVTVVAASAETPETAFNKTYDGTANVDVSKLALNGVLNAETNPVIFSGTYKTINQENAISAAQNLQIDFVSENINYIIVLIGQQNYQGSILQKQLLLTPNSITTKYYDTTIHHNVNLLSLDFSLIINADDVFIKSANFDSAEVGTRTLQIVLGGTTAENYYINPIANAEIVSLFLQIIFEVAFNNTTSSIGEIVLENNTPATQMQVAFNTLLQQNLKFNVAIGYSLEKWIVEYQPNAVTGENIPEKHISAKILTSDEIGAVKSNIKIIAVVQEKTVNLTIVSNLNGTINSTNLQLTDASTETQIIKSASFSYFSGFSLNLAANQRYKINSAVLKTGAKQGQNLLQGELISNLTNLISSTGLLTVLSEVFANNDSLVLEINFVADYWYDFVVSSGMIFQSESGYRINQALVFAGSGLSNKPYKITSVEEYALWAFVVNNNVAQTQTGKAQFNNSGTYYIVDKSVDFSLRFWTPIGTVQNPFNGQVKLQEPRTGIFVDNQDENYPSTVFDSKIMNDWKGLFGAVSGSAKISEGVFDFSMLYWIIAGVVVLIVFIIVIILIINKKRRNNISRMDVNPAIGFYFEDEINMQKKKDYKNRKK